MSGVCFFALQRLSVYDGGEPLTIEPGDVIPAPLIESWGDVGVSNALDSFKIAPLPAWVADLAETPKPRRVKAAA